MDHPALYSLPDQPETNVVPISGGPGSALRKPDPIGHLHRFVQRLRVWRMRSVAATANG